MFERIDPKQLKSIKSNRRVASHLSKALDNKNLDVDIRDDIVSVISRLDARTGYDLIINGEGFIALRDLYMCLMRNTGHEVTQQGLQWKAIGNDGVRVNIRDKLLLPFNVLSIKPMFRYEFKLVGEHNMPGRFIFHVTGEYALIAYEDPHDTNHGTIELPHLYHNTDITAALAPVFKEKK
jgi:hypothetical protein